MATESGRLSQHISQAHWSSPTRVALRKGFELFEHNLPNPKHSNGLSRSRFLRILGVPRSTAYRISKAETDGRSKKQGTRGHKRPDDGLLNETIAFCILARSKITITKISYPIGDDSKYPLIAASMPKIHTDPCCGAALVFFLLSQGVIQNFQAHTFLTKHCSVSSSCQIASRWTSKQTSSRSPAP